MPDLSGGAGVPRWLQGPVIAEIELYLLLCTSCLLSMVEFCCCSESFVSHLSNFIYHIGFLNQSADSGSGGSFSCPATLNVRHLEVSSRIWLFTMLRNVVRRGKGAFTLYDLVPNAIHLWLFCSKSLGSMKVLRSLLIVNPILDYYIVEVDYKVIWMAHLWYANSSQQIWWVPWFVNWEYAMPSLKCCNEIFYCH